MAEWAATERFPVGNGAAELAYVDRGEGPAVVLLHGFPTTSALWSAIGPGLAHDFRVIAPDMLGYGRSDQPEDAMLHPRAQAGYVRELLASQGIDRFAVVGHDVGGLVAQFLALDGDGVDVLILLDSDAFDLWPIEGLRMLQDAEPAQEEPGFVGDVIDLTLDLGTTNKAALTSELIAAFRDPFTRDDAAAAAFFRAVRAIDGEGLAGRDDELAALDVPSLLVWGEDDPYVGVEIADRLAATLARPALVTLPDVGHFTPLEAPEIVGALIQQFLATHLLGRAHSHGSEHAHGGPATGPVLVPLERHGPA